MKKILRGLLVIAVVLSLCFALTGCNMIKDMRKAQVFKDEDGNIVYNGQAYIPLPPCDTLSPSFNYDIDDVYLFVTEPDVPVLLSPFYGEDFTVSDDEVFLEHIDDTTYESFYYCREDKYDAVVAQIKDGFEAVGYTYTYDVMVDPDTYETKTKTYTLTEEQANALDLVRRSVDPELQLEYLDFENTVYINRRSEDGYFAEEVCMVHHFKGNYYVQEYTYVSYGTVSQVPDEYSDVFADMMAKSIDADASWDAVYESDMYLSDYTVW